MNGKSLLTSKWIFWIIVIAAFIYPYLFSSRSMLIVFTQVCIFAVFAMSYNLLLGYTGIVSFGHAMYFGIGAYAIGVTMQRFGSSLTSILVSMVFTILLTAILSYLVGMLTLRLHSHYYAMLTLAVASLFLVIAEKWRGLTMGNDGFTFSVPDVLKDRASLYLIALSFMLISFFLIKRFIHSPMGKVLAAVRENEKRAESIGFVVIHYKVMASVISGILAGFSGILYAISLRFVNTSVFAIDLTLDALLMTIIGGAGTLVGPLVGAGLIEFAKNWLMELAKVHWIFERWIILFGAIYILAVIFFPKGIVGTLKTSNWLKVLDKFKQQKANTEKEMSGKA